MSQFFDQLVFKIRFRGYGRKKIKKTFLFDFVGESESSWATFSIAKSDYPPGCLVSSSEYKLHYLLAIFGKKLFHRYKMNYR